jgi:serine/threonine-protein kinase
MLNAGTTLGGRYRLDERIAGGGMGDVWRGTDEVLGRTVAVKVLLPALLEEAGFAERFRGEARTMATINHPGVVDIYDYGSENGTAFLIMEYIEGDALSRTLSRVGRLTPARTMALVAQAADALHAAHEKGIVHRDVKPGNLLVRPNGTLVLTDFGIARSAAVGQLTAAGSVLGTASYISPEQASGAGATRLSDVYALGVVAYQCLAGVRPFEGENPLEIAMRHVRDAPPPLPADIPPAVRQVVERAMAKDPAARWPTAAALGQVARQTAAQLSGGTGTGLPPIGVSAPVSPGFSGPPGSPVSMPGSAMPGSPVVPPMSPAFGSPISGPPTSGQPIGASGTRVMPGAAGPGFTGAQPGHAARGAAGVPPPPPRGDTSYMDMGGYPPPAPPGPPGRTGGSGRRNNMMPAFIAIGVVVLLLVVAGVVYAATHTGGGTAGNNPTVAVTTTTGAPPAPTASTLNINCSLLKGRKATVAKRDLEKNGFKVVETLVDGAIPGVVQAASPCGRVAVGSTITLQVVKSDTGPGGNPFPSIVPSDGGGAGQPSDNPSTGVTCAPGETNVNGVCVPGLPSGTP